ncbi:aminomethyltransferase beta-barrel domain-containing protein [Mesorhizobium atlanticum]
MTSVELADGESGIAPGQACVLYSDDCNEARVLGGGFIERSERGAEAEAMLSRLAARPAQIPPSDHRICQLSCPFRRASPYGSLCRRSGCAAPGSPPRRRCAVRCASRCIA